MKRKNFSDERSINAFVKSLSNNYDRDGFESDFVPNLGNVGHTIKRKKTNLSKRRRIFVELKQGKTCDICKKKFEDIKSMVIDHCHTSRKIRGVLCQNCNHGLGKFMDDVEIMKNAIKYLEDSKDSDGIDYHNLKPIQIAPRIQ